MGSVRLSTGSGPGIANADWMARAACRGTNMAVFFDPDPGPALELCARCPVHAACLDYAITTPERYGVWGGMDQDQRRHERRRRLRGGRPHYMPTGPEPAPGEAASVHTPDPFTNPIGSTRRLQALVAAGHPPGLAVEVTGLSRPALVELRHGRRARIRASSAQAIADAYTAILLLPPPPNAARRRAEAAERGWHGPQAWEAVDIDDPAAVPRTAHSRAVA